MLRAFVDCLVEDVGTERAGRILATVAEHNGVDLDTQTNAARG